MSSVSNVTFGARESAVTNPLQFIQDPSTYPTLVPNVVLCELYALWQSTGFLTDVYGQWRNQLDILSLQLGTDMNVYMLEHITSLDSLATLPRNDVDPTSSA